MDNEYNINLIEDDSSNKLIELSMKIEDCINNLEKSFKRIGDNGDVWTGEVSNIAKETFEELITKYYEFRDLDKKYIEYLDKK